MTHLRLFVKRLQDWGYIATRTDYNKRSSWLRTLRAIRALDCSDSDTSDTGQRFR